MARRESIGARLRRMRLERNLSQRELSSPGVSYAYISRIEADARQPSVKALRKLAERLGVTSEHLETGKPTPLELGVADAGLDFATLTKEERQTIEAGVEHGAREGAHQAAKQVLEDRREAERAQLRARLDELSR